MIRRHPRPPVLRMPFSVRRRHRRAPAFRCLLLGVVLALVPLPAGAEALDLSQALRAFGFNERQIERVLAGQTVVDDAPTLLGNELNVKGAVLLSVPLADAVAWLRSPESLEIDVTLRAAGRLRPEAITQDVAAIAFTEGERAEAERLLAATPGIEFNLSEGEWARLRQAAEGTPAEDAVARASRIYREFLAARAEDYLRHGLAGIDDYARGGGRTSRAGRDLEIESRHLATTFGATYQPVIQALVGFPAHPDPHVENHFFWRKGAIDDRPIVILLHRLIAATPTHAVFANREFFVGHSYNVLQELGILVAEGERTLVVLDNVTLTDQITGFFGPVARRVAQARLRAVMEGIFASLPRHARR